ncbi:MAG: AAA family ATPase [Candidatus Latescibacterota bacterium]|nr:MAG: AAA family ATPase [Candidatus Latescibacterota bacterium]
MRTIAVMNQKGGCGKTTIAVNLSCAFSRYDKRVLLVDIDPQAHASVGLGIDSERVDVTSYELLMDPRVRISDSIVRSGDNLSVIPASTVLSGVEQELANTNGREKRLAEKLSQLAEGAFDFVLIDCPPSVGLLTFNALIASGEVLIPIDASFFSMHGLIKLRETLEVIEEELDHRMRVHVVCNNLDTRTRFSKGLLAEVGKFHSGVLADAYISHTVRLKECAAMRVSIFEIDETSKVSQQFLSLARELAEKAPRVETKRPAARVEEFKGPRKTPQGVLFSLDAPRASVVAVTGQFNNWSKKGVPLERDPKDGVWKVVVDIEPGAYEYRFIVDGAWGRDPANKNYIPNEFGGENSLLVV